MGEVRFDLLGDPIPEGWGKRGRPPHVRTDQNANKVMLLLAMGWPNQRIAHALGITPPTLRKHYFRELRSREEARDRMEARRFELLWEQMNQGNVAAIKEFGRIVEAQDRAALAHTFAESEADPPRPVRQPPMGKKEAAALAARTAGRGSDWGDDLLPAGGTRH